VTATLKIAVPLVGEAPEMTPVLVFSAKPIAVRLGAPVVTCQLV
jgi:hypothetical protein